MKAVQLGAQGQLNTSPDEELVPSLITGTQGCQSFVRIGKFLLRSIAVPSH